MNVLEGLDLRRCRSGPPTGKVSGRGGGGKGGRGEGGGGVERSGEEWGVSSIDDPNPLVWSKVVGTCRKKETFFLPLCGSPGGLFRLDGLVVVVCS